MTHNKTFQWNERIGRAHGIGNQCVKCTGWLVIAFIFPHFWYGWRRGPKSLCSHFKAKTFKSGPDGIEILANFVNKRREQERKTVCMFLANWATSEIAEGDWKFIQSLGRRVCNISEESHTSAPVCVRIQSITFPTRDIATSKKLRISLAYALFQRKRALQVHDGAIPKLKGDRLKNRTENVTIVRAQRTHCANDAKSGNFPTAFLMIRIN